MNSTPHLPLPGPAASDAALSEPGDWMWRSEAFAEDLDEPQSAPAPQPVPAGALALTTAQVAVALVGAIGLLLAA